MSPIEVFVVLTKTFLPTAQVSLQLVGLPGSVLVQCHIGSEIMVGVEGDANILSSITFNFAENELTIVAPRSNVKQEKPLEMAISVPLQYEANVTLVHVGAFIATANLDEVKLEAAGTESCLLGKVHILSGTLRDNAALHAADVNGNARVNLSRRAKATLPKFWGGLKVNAIENSHMSVTGSFTEIDAELCGSATVTACGEVTRDLSVKDTTSANGFQHSGHVHGQSRGVRQLR